MKSLVLAAALLLPSVALAQPAAPATTVVATSKDVQALIAKAREELPAVLKSGRLFASETILQITPYRVALEYRSPKGMPSLHKTDAELMYVIEGAGTIVTGGQLVNAKDINPGNQSGESIDGGTANKLAKGDFIFLPEGTAHMAYSDGLFVLMTLHVPRSGPH